MTILNAGQPLFYQKIPSYLSRTSNLFNAANHNSAAFSQTAPVDGEGTYPPILPSWPLFLRILATCSTPVGHPGYRILIA